MSLDFLSRYGPWGLVAGASEGLGAAWSRALAQRGLSLIMIARRSAPLERTAQELRQACGIDVETHALDLGTPNATDEILRAAKQREIGFFVYNAATSTLGGFLERPLEDQLRSLDVNCRAPLTLTHALAAQMVERRRGGIVLMSSLVGLHGAPYLATYSATKAFNLVLADSLWFELRERGVDVLACCAGATKTPGFLLASPNGEPGELEPEDVVVQALAALGTRGSFVPGTFNRMASFALGRLLPRRLVVKILGDRTRQLRSR